MARQENPFDMQIKLLMIGDSGAYPGGCFGLRPTMTYENRQVLTDSNSIGAAHTYKLTPAGVGKTCLLLRYANDSFSPTFITTIGIDFKIKNLELDGCVWGLDFPCRSNSPRSRPCLLREPTGSASSCRSGTRRARSASAPSPPPTSAARRASCLSTT